MMTIIIWLMAGLSLTGTILNLSRSRLGFLFWAVSNLFWVVYNCGQHEYAQAFLFATYFILSVIGWFTWK